MNAQPKNERHEQALDEAADDHAGGDDHEALAQVRAAAADGLGGLLAQLVLDRQEERVALSKTAGCVSDSALAAECGVREANRGERLLTLSMGFRRQVGGSRRTEGLPSRRRRRTTSRPSRPWCCCFFAGRR